MYSMLYYDFTVASIALFLLYKLYSRNRLPLPPGPKGILVIGNIFDMPSTRPWETFAKWGEQYGPISSVTVLGQTFVVLNDYRTAYELLQMHGSLYADRPVMEMTSMSGWDRTLGPARYGPHLREQRKLLTRVIGSKSDMKKFLPDQEFQSTMFLKRVLEKPDDIGYASRKTAGAMVLQVVYGYRILEDRQDPLVHLADKALAEFSEIAQTSAFLVNLMPILKHLPTCFPGTGFKRLANKCRRSCDDFADVPLKYVQDRMAKGPVPPSYVADLLSRDNLTDDDMFNIKWSAASFYAGGADTSVSIITCYFLAITKYPEVQTKAWAEMDAVVGQDRLPNFEDRESLPYLAAVCKELYRWLPIVPLGIPHLAMDDNVYEGYHIPKDTLVIANVWKILHDADIYKDPFIFNPDRFMGPNAEMDPQDAGLFGFGRRICPGNHLADISVWINVAKAVAALDISKAMDETGKPIDPVADVSDGLITRPLPFECVVQPRSDKVSCLIQEALSSDNLGRDSGAYA